jgi:hypothetical protein
MRLNLATCWRRLSLTQWRLLSRERLRRGWLGNFASEHLGLFQGVARTSCGLQLTLNIVRIWQNEASGRRCKRRGPCFVWTHCCRRSRHLLRLLLLAAACRLLHNGKEDFVARTYCVSGVGW